MKLLHRLLSCLNLLALFILGSGIAAAQNGITTSANPSPVGSALTITATLCGGPKTFLVDFYESNSPSTVFTGSPMGHAVKPPGGYATYVWTPSQEGTFYLGVKPEVGGMTYCGPNPSGVLTQVISKAPSYYGFYDSSSPGFPDETPATSSFANTTWIGCSSPADCNTRLQEAQTYNMHAVVSFASPGLPAPGSSSTVVQSWLSSWKSNWQSYTSVFAPYVSNGTIAAFYPYDEPFGGEWSAGNNALDTTSYLNSVATTIKQTFSSAKVAMVFTGANTFTYLTHGQNIIPASYDWVGIDIYECWTGCQDTNKTLSESYSWYVQTLEGYLYSGQRVILLPATAIYYGGTLAQFRALPSSDWTGYVSIVNNIFTLSETDYHVVGVFGFLYQNYYQGGGPTSPNVWVGASDPSMAAMLTAVTNFGKNVEKR